MTTNPQGLQPLDLGPSGKQLAQNLKRVRSLRGLSLRKLAEQLEGVKLSADAINKIEKEQRRAHTDELVALAVALQVNPSSLLLPWTDEESATAKVTGVGSVSARIAWDWVDGERPLKFEPGTDERTQIDQFRIYVRPPIRRMLRAGFEEMGRDVFEAMPDSKYHQVMQALLDAGQDESGQRAQVRFADDEEDDTT